MKAHRTGTYSGAPAQQREEPVVSIYICGEQRRHVGVQDTLGRRRHIRDMARRYRGRPFLEYLRRGRHVAQWRTASTWAGSDYSGAASTTNSVAATSDTFQITGVIAVPGIELPAADRAALIMRPADQELRLCQRYYERFGAGCLIIGYQHDQPAGHLPVPCAKANVGRTVWLTFRIGKPNRPSRCRGFRR